MNYYCYYFVLFLLIGKVVEEKKGSRMGALLRVNMYIYNLIIVFVNPQFGKRSRPDTFLLDIKRRNLLSFLFLFVFLFF